MSARQQGVWTALLGFHLFLILAVSLQDVCSTLVAADTFLPEGCKPALRETAALASAATDQSLKPTNRLRQLLRAYTDCAGIEVGYSYFAPTVPGNSKLAFELHYPDGRVEYDLPVVGGAAAGDRVSTLLDHLHAIQYRRLREAIVRNLVLSVRAEHPQAVMIRAVFGVADLTNPAEYRAGKRNSYRALYAYDFRFPPRLPRSASP